MPRHACVGWQGRFTLSYKGMTGLRGTLLFSVTWHAGILESKTIIIDIDGAGMQIAARIGEKVDVFLKCIMAEAMMPRHACEGWRDRFTLSYKGMTGLRFGTAYRVTVEMYVFNNFEKPRSPASH